MANLFFSLEVRQPGKKAAISSGLRDLWSGNPAKKGLKFQGCRTYLPKRTPYLQKQGDFGVAVYLGVAIGIAAAAEAEGVLHPEDVSNPGHG